MRCCLLIMILLFGVTSPTTGVSAEEKERPSPDLDHARLLRLLLAVHDDDDERTRRVEAIERALSWLAAHQSPSGVWEITKHGSWCDGKRVSSASTTMGFDVFNVGVTGLVLSAFLGAGYGAGEHEYTDVVREGLAYLAKTQTPDGRFGPQAQRDVYNHACATLALVEAYWMTRDERWKKPAQRGLDYLRRARNKYFAWRYGVKPGDNGTSESWFAFRPIHMARLVNEHDADCGRDPSFEIDRGAYDGVKAHLQKVTDPDYGKVGYLTRGSNSYRDSALAEQYPADRTAACTAMGCWLRMATGEVPRKSKIIQRGVELCVKRLPEWAGGGAIDLVYWLAATPVFLDVEGEDRTTWDDALGAAVVETQLSGERCGVGGSWEPFGAWAAYGGRVYSTAMMVLLLEMPVRWPAHSARWRYDRDERLREQIKRLHASALKGWRRAQFIEAWRGKSGLTMSRTLRWLLGNPKTTDLGLDLAQVTDVAYATEVLCDILKRSRKYKTRAAVAAALGKMPPTEGSIARLETAMTKDRSKTVRIAAARSHARLTGDPTKAKKVLRKEGAELKPADDD